MNDFKPNESSTKSDCYTKERHSKKGFYDKASKNTKIQKRKTPSRREGFRNRCPVNTNISESLDMTRTVFFKHIMKKSKKINLNGGKKQKLYS